MERLTYDFCVGNKHCWQVKGADNLECREVCRNQGENGCTDCPIAKAFDRLAAYEDTGLEPEEIERILDSYGRGVTLRTENAQRLEIINEIPINRLRELAQAEKEGRLVVLPCDVGDKLYDVTLGEVREKTVISLSMFVPESVNHLVIHAEDFRTAITSYELQDIGETLVAAERDRYKAERENPQPLTLEEVKEHITKGHPNDIKPLYVDFKPTIPIDYTSRWRDAYNLSRLIAGRGDEYGKTWIAYRSKPKEENT